MKGRAKASRERASTDSYNDTGVVYHAGSLTRVMLVPGNSCGSKPANVATWPTVAFLKRVIGSSASTPAHSIMRNQTNKQTTSIECDHILNAPMSCSSEKTGKRKSMGNTNYSNTTTHRQYGTFFSIRTRALNFGENIPWMTAHIRAEAHESKKC